MDAGTNRTNPIDPSRQHRIVSILNLDNCALPMRRDCSRWWVIFGERWTREGREA